MSAQRKTTLGTPCSDKWDDEWIQEVDHTEQQLDRRICGAHSPAWTPCKLGSTHRNGRCRFHGGAKGIGAPLGNRNAIVHGLYSRRLQRCGLHCPLWQHCPQSGKDVLDLPEPERPACVYEAIEYDALTFSLEKEKVSKEKSMAAYAAGDSSEDGDDCEGDAHEHSSLAQILHHNIATFQVMLTRAQAALGVAKMTEQTHASTDAYTMSSPKVSALLQAETWISRELRHWLRLYAYEPLRKVLGLKEDKDPRPLSLPDMMVPIIAKAGGPISPSTHPDWFDSTDDIDPAPA